MVSTFSLNETRTNVFYHIQEPYAQLPHKRSIEAVVSSHILFDASSCLWKIRLNYPLISHRIPVVHASTAQWLAAQCLASLGWCRPKSQTPPTQNAHGQCKASQP